MSQRLILTALRRLNLHIPTAWKTTEQKPVKSPRGKKRVTPVCHRLLLCSPPQTLDQCLSQPWADEHRLCAEFNGVSQNLRKRNNSLATSVESEQGSHGSQGRDEGRV